jgi:hypothetical protein
MVDKQDQFTGMVALLILYARSMGYQLTFGDAYRDPRVEYGHPQSFHRDRLAVDFNLFKDGTYLTRTEDHKPLGLYWESMGGSWGGRFEDGNHYSLGEN